MEEKLIDNEKIITSMLIKWIDRMDFLDNTKKVSLLNLCVNLLKKGRKSCEPLSYAIDKDLLNRSLEKLELSAENNEGIVCALIDFSEDILPLGSVVVLKDDFIKSENGREVKLIITKRFLCNEKAGLYFTYAGALYPTGNLLSHKLINFNKECIEKVCHTGLRDEDEERFVLALKNEVIFNKNIHSVIFADEDQLKILKEEAIKEDE